MSCRTLAACSLSIGAAVSFIAAIKSHLRRPSASVRIGVLRPIKGLSGGRPIGRRKGGADCGRMALADASEVVLRVRNQYNELDVLVAKTLHNWRITAAMSA